MTRSPEPIPFDIIRTEKGCIVKLLVQPRASRNELVGPLNGFLKVRLTSPPVEGAANDLCIEFFAKLLKLPRNKIQIIAGAASRHKRLCIEGVSPEELLIAITPFITEEMTRKA